MARVTREFTIDELEETYNLPWSAISNTEWDKRRWYTIRLLVFMADDDLFYEVHYMDPATETQDGQERWEEDYQTHTVTAFQVKSRQVITTEWVEVEE